MLLFVNAALGPSLEPLARLWVLWQYMIAPSADAFPEVRGWKQKDTKLNWDFEDGEYASYWVQYILDKTSHGIHSFVDSLGMRSRFSTKYSNSFLVKRRRRNEASLRGCSSVRARGLALAYYLPSRDIIIIIIIICHLELLSYYYYLPSRVIILLLFAI